MIAAIIKPSDATTVEPPREKYVMLGEIAINAAKASAPARPSIGRIANAIAMSSRPHSITTTRELASLAPTAAKIHPCDTVTHDASTVASASRALVASASADNASDACAASSGRAPRAIMRVMSA